MKYTGRRENDFNVQGYTHPTPSMPSLAKLAPFGCSSIWSESGVRLAQKMPVGP
jgi:hypothetical protein